MKNEKNKKLELGRELAQQREAKGLSIAQLSDRTKIAVKNITHIENGVFDFLPSAYVKAYLSAIAVELGLDSGVVLRKYYASFVKDVDGSSHDSKATTYMREPPTPVITETVPEREPAPVKYADKEDIKPVQVPDQPAPELEKKPTESDNPPASTGKSTAKPVVAKAESKQPAPPVAGKEQTPPKLPVVEEKKPTPFPIEKLTPEEKVKPAKAPQYTPSSSRWDEFKLVIQFYSVFIFGALFLALALVVIFWIVPERQLKTKVQELKALMQTQTPVAQVDTLPQVVRQTPVDSLPSITQPARLDSLPPQLQSQTQLQPQAQRKLLSLDVLVSDSTWLKVVYNDSIAEEGIFAPGDEKTWQGYDRFYMRIGNASGILLLLDGKELGTLPQSGVITNIQIDPDGIKSIKKTQFPKAMGVSSN